MLVINYGRIWEFIEKHPDSEANLNAWYGTTRKANWRTFADIQQGFLPADSLGQINWQNPADTQQEHPYAKQVGRHIVFSIGHGQHKYKVVTRILFRSQTLLIRGVFTHEEYMAIRLKE